MSYLALDVGASSGKLFRGNFDGARLSIETVHRFENRAIPLRDGLYWDFLGIWQNLCVGLQKASLGGNIKSIGVDSYCNDFSFIDKDGELLLPIRCYRDERTIRCADAIYATMSPAELYRETGNQIAPFNTLMQLAAMRAEGKDALLDGAHRMLYMPDLIAYYMTGETLAETSICSVSQMYSFENGGWSDKILEVYNIPKRLFGTLTVPGTISGKTTRQFERHWGLENFDFVSVCEHDTASAFLAASGGGNQAIISSGTWAIVGCESATPVISDYGFKYNIANEGSLSGHHRLLRNVMGSWLLQELIKDYVRDGIELSFAELINLAESAKPFAFLIDVDDDVFFSPGETRRKIREKCVAEDGRIPETIGEFARCICESLAMKYRWAIERLETLTGRKFNEISVIGGGAQDVLSCQMTADVTGRLVAAGPLDASAIGNILTQLLAHGEIGSIAQGRELVKRSFPQTHYEPKSSTIWNKAYDRYTARLGL